MVISIIGERDQACFRLLVDRFPNTDQFQLLFMKINCLIKLFVHLRRKSMGWRLQSYQNYRKKVSEIHNQVPLSTTTLGTPLNTLKKCTLFLVEHREGTQNFT